MSQTLDDNLLIDGIKEGNSEMIKQLQVMVISVAKALQRKYNFSNEDMEDLAQEAIIIIFTKIRNSNITYKYTFKIYIYSVVKYAQTNRYRKNKKLSFMNTYQEYMSIDFDLFEDFEHTVNYREDCFNKNLELLRNMKVDDYNLLMLHYQGGLSIKEIAFWRKTTENTLYNKFSILRKNLRVSIKACLREMV